LKIWHNLSAGLTRAGKMDKFLISIVIVMTFFSLSSTYAPSSCFSLQSKFSTWISSSLSLSGKNSIDKEFSDSMIKPIPDWYVKEKEDEEIETAKLVENRQRIIKEFNAKYILTEEEKLKLNNARRMENEARVARRKEIPWYKKALGLKTQEIDTELEEDNIGERKLSVEKWSKLKDEDEDVIKPAGLPGFFEVFPELIFRWPVWSKSKDGNVIKCKVDQDCLFPQACCSHPILPGDKFCCTGGNKKRDMTPKYVTQRIQPDQGSQN
jgi:hypothetical protein